MDGRFSNPFVSELEDPGFMLNISDSPPFSEEKTTPTPSPKRSKRTVQKRVVSVPISDVEGSRLKGEGAPPSDSWAWRKYGQKPIKGSPYPRGYYRCSSSKGCPARKQVERSRIDPTKLVITYACDHNHVGPVSKSSGPTVASIAAKITTTTTATTAAATTSPTDVECANSPAQESKLFLTQPNLEPETELELGTHFTNLVDDPLITSDDLSWFSDVASTSPALFETQMYMGNIEDADVAMIFPMGDENEDEDKSLFADLGELPECSVVFRRAQGCNLRTSLCGSSG